jgi:hypothetical protein
MNHTLEQLRSGQLAGSRRLKIAASLTEVPREVFGLADTLEILDLSGNRLSSLPADLPRLERLRIVFCSDNQFTELPEVLGQCPNLDMVGFKANAIRRVAPDSLPEKLRWLILTDNRIEELPAEIGRCTRLQKLMLAGNRLQALPGELAACTRLELLRIAANRLAELPGWLFSLPRLSWLAYAGNPFCGADEKAALEDMPITGVPWGALQMHQQLGEGASGVIHRATQANGDQSLPVAVKLFKGAVTSDGLPQSEMAACIAAGEHPNLIPVWGKVQHHPAGAAGLVMPLIDPAFSSLAGPPSLESCTRDIYPPDSRFSVETALAIARDIASAASHLHCRGILHGDLYGHNILHCGRGQVLLGDFGAASFFDPKGPYAHGLQRIEARAFGCLLEELIDRCSEPAGSRIMDQLADLKTACLDGRIEDRPLLQDIARRLSGISGS